MRAVEKYGPERLVVLFVKSDDLTLVRQDDGSYVLKQTFITHALDAE